MIEPEIDVNYYRMRKSSLLYPAIKLHHISCYQFIRYAELLVSAFRADSAVTSSGPKGIRVCGLNFADDSAPPSWLMGVYGYFYPVKPPHAQFFESALSHFSTLYPDAPRSLRYCLIGKGVIVSIRTNRNGRSIEFPDADPIDGEKLNQLIEVLPNSAKTGVVGLSRYLWSPLDQHKTKAFTPSAKVLRLNRERMNFHGSFKLEVKHSTPVRVARRCARRALDCLADWAHEPPKLSPR